MHRLLTRQLQRHLDPSLAGDSRLAQLLSAINQHYHEEERSRRLLEHALDISSQELFDAIGGERRQHAMLRGVMDSIPDLIYFKSTEGRYLGCNKAVGPLFGLSEADLLGRSDEELFAPGRAAELAARDHAVLSSERPHRVEQWLTVPGGGQVCVEVLRSPYFDEDKRLLGIIGIARDITERTLAARQILRLANFDSLTGLANRRHYNERLLDALATSRRADTSAALMFIDLDKFKQVNDVLGHEVGDLLLVEVASRLNACVRESDIVARLGGDEFVVVATALQQLGLVDRIAQKINACLALPFTLGEHTVNIAGTIGIALYPQDAEDAATLTKQADQAMYAAKAAGRNRYAYYASAPAAGQ